MVSDYGKSSLCYSDGNSYFAMSIDHPSWYNFPNIECIDVVENFNFNVGNAIKYCWRADHKGKPLEDLQKARWYIDREIQRRQDED